jgi:hypothetical protein
MQVSEKGDFDCALVSCSRWTRLLTPSISPTVEDRAITWLVESAGMAAGGFLGFLSSPKIPGEHTNCAQLEKRLREPVQTLLKCRGKCSVGGVRIRNKNVKHGTFHLIQVRSQAVAGFPFRTRIAKPSTSGLSSPLPTKKATPSVMMIGSSLQNDEDSPRVICSRGVA